MSTTARSRWLDWKPKVRISAESAKVKASETTKSLSDVFVASPPADSPEIEVGPDPAELALASTILNRAGVRIMALEGGATIGVWSDLDGPKVRAAFRILGSDRLPVRYLDEASIPMRY